MKDTLIGAFILGGQRLFPARRGANGRFPKDTRRDRLALFFHRLPYRFQNKPMRPDGVVTSRGRWWHVPCVLFGHLYDTSEHNIYNMDYSARRHTQVHVCTACGLTIKDGQDLTDLQALEHGQHISRVCDIEAWRNDGA